MMQPHKMARRDFLVFFMVDQYSNCGGAGGYDAYVLSAVDINDPTSKIILIEVQTQPGDVDTVNQIMKSFYVLF